MYQKVLKFYTFDPRTGKSHFPDLTSVRRCTTAKRYLERRWPAVRNITFHTERMENAFHHRTLGDIMNIFPHVNVVCTMFKGGRCFHPLHVVRIFEEGIFAQVVFQVNIGAQDHPKPNFCTLSSADPQLLFIQGVVSLSALSRWNSLLNSGKLDILVFTKKENHTDGQQVL